MRIFNYCWFWDLEKTFPGYPQFDVAENILHTVNNQGMIWMGLFMAPGLPILNLIKLVLMFYLKSWAVLVTNVPHETVFKASENGNFYLFLLLMMLFLCILPVAYTLVTQGSCSSEQSHFPLSRSSSSPAGTAAPSVTSRRSTW